MWYLNPKNILLAALLALVVVIGGLYLWQRNTVVRQAGEITNLTVANTGLTTQVGTYKKNIADMKRTQKEQQQIANDSAALMSYVSQMKESKCLGVKDEETISDITFYYNSGGLLTARGDNPASGKSVPETDTASAYKPDWSVKQLVENYLILTDYVLQLERTVNCYELP